MSRDELAVMNGSKCTAISWMRTGCVICSSSEAARSVPHLANAANCSRRYVSIINASLSSIYTCYVYKYRRKALDFKEKPIYTLIIDRKTYTDREQKRAESTTNIKKDLPWNTLH